jgi:DNA-binding transcriptional LysR family regulator
MPVTFSVAFAAGVTPTKWTRLWAERRPDVPLEVFRSEPGEQETVLRDGRATVSLVRLPINDEGLSVIALYREIPVVVMAKDHPLADSDSFVVADLAEDHLLQNPDEVPEWRDVADEIRNGTRRELPEVRNLDDTMELVAAGVGIVILPHSLARLHSRKDVVSRPVEDVAETQVSLAWLAAETTDLIEEFVGIVRGRTAASSRVDTVVEGEKVKKEKKTDKAKAAAKALRVATAKAKPAQAKNAIVTGRTRNSASPKKGNRRGSR